MKINVDEGVIMQKINLYAGIAAVGTIFLPQPINAQCISPIQDCYTLGYTQNSCPNGKGVKCPFGSGWYCGGTAVQDCIKLGYDKDCSGPGESGIGETCNGKYQSCTCDYSYQYTCTGTGYSGGLGNACNSKFTSCICANGYEWKDGLCQTQVLNGPQGDLFYCNDKVVGVKTSDMNFYVAMNDIGKMNWNDANNQCINYSFCNNIKGRLPTKDNLVTLYNNKSTINTLLSINNGTKLSESDYYWSSTKGSSLNRYYVVRISGETSNWHFIYYYYPNYEYFVRPILTSW